MKLFNTQTFLALVFVWGVFGGIAQAQANGVTVSTPSNGATVLPPFTLTASSATCSGQPVGSMAYSVNGSGTLYSVVDANSLDVQVPDSILNTGSNILHVKSWGNQGAGCDTDVTVNVPASGVSISAPTSGASVVPPFTLTASSVLCGGQPVSTMAYSVNSSGTLYSVVDATSLSTQVPDSILNTGSNILHVKSWGNQGAGCDTDVTVNVPASGVTISAPASGATVTPPFTLSASSVLCSGQPVSTMAYSVNSSGTLYSVVDATSLDAQVPDSILNTGSNILHVKSWGNQGAGCDTDVTVNVPASGVSVTAPASGATVTPPFTLSASSTLCGGQSVSAMAYSVNSSGTLYSVVDATSLDAQVPDSILNTGSNILHVKSWGNQGAGCDTDVTVNVPASGVSVSAPASGATVTPPFTLSASSTLCGGQSVSAMAYSVNSSGTLYSAVSATSLSAQVPASILNTGSNILHVKSWGNQGAGCDTDVTVNVPGYNGSASIPNPPSSAVLISSIQETNGWTTTTGAASQCPGGVASSSCNPITASYNTTVEHTADPVGFAGSQDSTGEFQLYNGPANATAIWGQAAANNTAVSHFIWDFYVYVNSTNYAASELDLYTVANGQRFMMGSQCDRVANSWDTWNEQTQQWIQNTQIQCQSVLPAGSWTHVIMYNTVNTANNTYTYGTFNINGKDYPLNQTQPTGAINWPAGLIGVQVQLDANGSGTGVNEYIENMQLYTW